MSKFILQNYVNDNGKEVVRDWINSLDNTFIKRINLRLRRIEESGNFGDYKQINSFLYELRFNFGPGFRIYYTIIDNVVVFLINGGDKKTQTKDIQKASEILEKIKG